MNGDSSAGSPLSVRERRNFTKQAESRGDSLSFRLFVSIRTEVGEEEGGGHGRFVLLLLQNEGRSRGPLASGPWGRMKEDLVDPVEDPVDLWPPVRKAEWRKILWTSGHRSVRQNERRSRGPLATSPWGRVKEDPEDLWQPVRKAEWRKILWTSGNRSVRQNEGRSCGPLATGPWGRMNLGRGWGYGCRNERWRRWRRHGWWNRKQTNEFNKQTNNKIITKTKSEFFLLVSNLFLDWTWGNDVTTNGRLYSQSKNGRETHHSQSAVVY